jgi:ribosomal protein L11 methyltransferase
MTVRYELDLTPGDDPEIIAARLWAAGAVGVQELPDRLVGWFDARVGTVPPGGGWAPEPTRDWLAVWREGIRPVWAGRVHVVPTWLVDDHPTPRDAVRLVLDPGIAFGSGHHATTRLCLEELQAASVPGANVLDVGCGTGVLAIAAALLGAGAVETVDVDSDAVVATRRNAATNDVTVTARLGGVEAASAPADIVLANLLTPTLHDLAGALVAAVRPGGVLIASGVAVERAPGVVGALAVAGAEPHHQRDAEGWCVLVHTVEEGPA